MQTPAVSAEESGSTPRFRCLATSGTHATHLAAAPELHIDGIRGRPADFCPGERLESWTLNRLLPRACKALPLRMPCRTRQRVPGVCRSTLLYISASPEERPPGSHPCGHSSQIRCEGIAPGCHG